MVGQKWIAVMAAAAVTACPLVCSLRGMIARAETGASDAKVHVCPCCPRPVQQDRSPQPVDEQRPADNCICQGAIVNLDRVVTCDAAQGLLGPLALDIIATDYLFLSAIDRQGDFNGFDVGPLSGRDRCILRASLRC